MVQLFTGQGVLVFLGLGTYICKPGWLEEMVWEGNSLKPPSVTPRLPHELWSSSEASSCLMHWTPNSDMQFSNGGKRAFSRSLFRSIKGIISDLKTTQRKKIIKNNILLIIYSYIVADPFYSSILNPCFYRNIELFWRRL